MKLNGGVSTARNTGLSQSKGDNSFFGLDDKWFPNKLENQLSLLAEHPEIDVLGCAFDGLYLNNVPEGTL